MDLDAARDFLRENHRGVLATRRSDGGIQQSPVIATVDAEGRVVISQPRDRDQDEEPAPRPVGPAVRVHGPLLRPVGVRRGDGRGRLAPEAMDPLIDYYKRFPGENPDWDDYRARMERERACAAPRSRSSAPAPTARGRSDDSAAGCGASLSCASPRSSVDRAAAF